MLGRRGFRWRLTVTLVALVALTAIVLGVSAYFLVSRSLHDRLVSDATAQAAFDISVLATDMLDADPTPDEIVASGLIEAIRQRGGAETLVLLADGASVGSTTAISGAATALSPALRAHVASGELAYESVTVDGTPYLVVGGRPPSGTADLYLFFPAAAVEDALGGLAQALILVTLLLIGFAILVAGLVARQVLRPVRDAGDAAMAIGRGELEARVPVESTDEFGRWASAFNAMAASLERTVSVLRETEARQRRFAADVSHELRTPVTALVTEADLLRPRLNTMDRDGRHLGELLVADVARLRQLVDELMEISRLDARSERIEPSEVDLQRFLQAIVSRRLPGAAVNAQPGLILVTDPRRLERIVGNLVDNAREHGEGRQVEVSAAALAEGGAVIAVADRGPGVPPDQLPLLFERFSKVDPSRQRGGSGLGLAIAHEHAVGLGGTLTAAARESGGLVFELRLPNAPLPRPTAEVVT